MLRLNQKKPIDSNHMAYRLLQQTHIQQKDFELSLLAHVLLVERFLQLLKEELLPLEILMQAELLLFMKEQTLERIRYQETQRQLKLQLLVELLQVPFLIKALLFKEELL
jgi:hypothetical protein